MVPLYGDMMIAPYNYIKNGPNYDPSKWPACESSHPSPQSNILGNLEMIRERHMHYISQLARHNNEVGANMCKYVQTSANRNMHHGVVPLKTFRINCQHLAASDSRKSQCLLFFSFKARKINSINLVDLRYKTKCNSLHQE